jgi:uncharacterized membrane protein
MKINKQIMKKINSPKTAFIFVLLVIIALMVITFIFRSIRVIFDMDKKEEIKMDNAKITANSSNKSSNNSSIS